MTGQLSHLMLGTHRFWQHIGLQKDMNEQHSSGKSILPVPRQHLLLERKPDVL